MRMIYFKTTSADAEAFAAEMREDGYSAYVIEWRSDYFEIRLWKA